MIKKLKEEAKLNEVKILTHINNEVYKKYAKDEEILCVYNKKEDYLYIMMFVEKQEGVYQFICNDFNFQLNEILIKFQKREEFEKTNSLTFLTMPKNFINLDIDFFKKNFKNIISNTKEFRMKLLLKRKDGV